jgi:hypothetical protein
MTYDYDLFQLGLSTIEFQLVFFIEHIITGVQNPAGKEDSGVRMGARPAPRP